MRWLYTVPLRLRSLFRRRRTEQELDEELRDHLHRRSEEGVARGLTPDDARYEALRTMEGLEQRKEECRDARRVNLFDDLRRDISYAGRMLRRSPGFTAVAVLSLAIGIGANTAIFTVIDALMLRTLPVSDPGKLVNFFVSEPGFPVFALTRSYKGYERYRDLTQAFTAVSAVGLTDRWSATVNGLGGDSEASRTPVAVVSGNYFSMLGVNALAGRTLTQDDDRVQGGHPVAVIGYGFWQRRLGLAPNVLGRTLTLNGVPYTILGIAPRGFTGDWVGKPTDIWVSTAMLARIMPDAPTGGGWLRLVGRLKPGVPVEQARAAVDTVYQQDLREFSSHPTPQQLQFMTHTRILLKAAAGGIHRSANRSGSLSRF